MPLDIDPTVDYAFKRLFGDPANVDLLLHLLNAVLGLEPPIVDVVIVNPFNEKEFEADKLSVLDIKACSASGTWYNVEIQSRAHWSVRPRLAYYAASLYVDQLTSGNDYTALAPAITICFLKEVLCPESENPHLRFVLSDRAADVVLTDRLQVHTIELPKYNFEGLRLEAAAAQLQSASPLVQWAFFLSRAAELEAADLRQLLPEREFVKATGVVEMIGQTPEERMQYRARQKAELDYNTFVNVVRIEAHEAGLEEGREEGREQGREEGRDMGHHEGLVEQVQLLQELLGEPVATAENLAPLDSAALKQQIADLKLRLRTRQS